MWVGAARRLSLQRFGVADYAEIGLSEADCPKRTVRSGLSEHNDMRGK
jgi:hypothetical protein